VDNANTVKFSATPSDKVRLYCESVSQQFVSHQTQLKRIYGAS